MHNANLAAYIDELLPQTQCRRCGYAGCRPYADAIAAGEAAIDRCPPGGEATIMELARLLNREVVPLDHSSGTHYAPVRAVIDEDTCIGCTKCIAACPVDAIVGAAKLMHTVIADACTGCELCLPPCPVDCIDLVPAGADVVPAIDDGAREQAHRARARYEWRNLRLARDAAEREAAHPALASQPARPTLEQKQAVIRAAVARVKAKRAAGQLTNTR
ncbi:MAG: RnfABCDGE type electron transport complex subunit B [Gammaproteobacteria bacterium]|nr:RnfABCDGE type electron transport complex subunit B [Gammaproteobacteria bacterium]